MLIDLTKSPLDNFYNLLFEKVQIRFTSLSIYLDEPSEYLDEEGVNTKITIYAQANNRYKNKATLKYNRVNIGHYNNGLPYKQITYDENMSIEQLKQKIYEDLKLIPSEVSISLETIPLLKPYEELVFTITAIASSLCYTGSLEIRINSGLDGKIKIAEDGVIKLSENDDKILSLEEGNLPLNLFNGELDGFGVITTPIALYEADGMVNGFDALD